MGAPAVEGARSPNQTVAGTRHALTLQMDLPSGACQDGMVDRIDRLISNLLEGCAVKGLSKCRSVALAIIFISLNPLGAWALGETPVPMLSNASYAVGTCNLNITKCFTDQPLPHDQKLRVPNYRTVLQVVNDHRALGPSRAAAAILLIAMLAGFYMLPTILSSLKHIRHNSVIAALNIFLGWTGIFWTILLAWALLARPDPGGIEISGY